MSILKCKMCGGDLQIQEGMTVCECEYCGSKQTVPVVDNEKKATLYERANRLRYNCEFDKAETVYESIVAEFRQEAEAYWGILLCKYGIEYVDDPVTGKKVPTCHRSSFDSVMDDPDLDMVMENSDTMSRQVYREQAKQIEEIRKGIIEVSGKEEPYDIFICYKETAEDGQRTIDSVIAQDVYDALTEKGYRVFFSRITLEDKLGTEYEPYIFAALNSAKVMLAFGTTYDYYNAVWVKNEWSRFLKLMATDKSKYLIPCYKDIDAYDIPKEFAKLQAQDMGKVGAIQDLIRGIDKICGKVTNKSIVTIEETSENSTKLVERGNILLEDGEWDKADKCFEEALDSDPHNAQAHLGKWLCCKKFTSIDEFKRSYVNSDKKVKTEELEVELPLEQHVKEVVKKYHVDNYLDVSTIRQLYRLNNKYTSELNYRKRQLVEFEESINDKMFIRAKQYADIELLSLLNDITNEIYDYINDAIEQASLYDSNIVSRVQSECEKMILDSDLKLKNLYERALADQKKDYEELEEALHKAKRIKDLETVKSQLFRLEGYEKTNAYIQEIDSKIKKKTIRKRISIIALILVLVSIYPIYWGSKNVLIPYVKYNDADKYRTNHEYEKAINIYKEIYLYKDSSEQLKETYSLMIDYYIKANRLDDAMEIIDQIGDKEKIQEIYARIGDENRIQEFKYNIALKYKENGYLSKASELLQDIKEYKDSADIYREIQDEIKVQCELASDYITERKYEEAKSVLAFVDQDQRAKNMMNYIDWVTEDIDFSDINVGDTFFLGILGTYTYERIEWVVLDKKDNKVLAISRNVVMKLTGKDVTSVQFDWYYTNRFTDTEKQYICGDENDSLFIITKSDMDRYFVNDLKQYFTCSVGSDLRDVARIKNNRSLAVWAVLDDNDPTKYLSVGEEGIIENYTYNGLPGIRPAVWIKTEH